MYEKFFGIREKPFSLTPDTSFFYGYPSHREALNVLLVALHDGDGFIKVTGEVGTGKTLLCRQLLNELEQDFVTVFLPNPLLTPTALWLAIAEELDVAAPEGADQHRLGRLIAERLIEHTASGRHVVICLDEAQAMPEESLEALRLLTNLETEKSKLLQVVLFGQPELDARLESPSVRQLRQRIVHSYHLLPLDREAVSAYVTHRLVVAGYAGTPLFTAGALDALYRSSRGIPRLVNIIANKSLMLAYGRGDLRIEREHLRIAADDTAGAYPLAVDRRQLRRSGALALLGALLAAGGWMLWAALA